MEFHEHVMNHHNTDDQWGDDMQSTRRDRVYNDDGTVQESYDRYGSSGHFSNHYDDEHINHDVEHRKNSNDIIDPYDDGSALYQLDHDEFEEFRQEDHTINSRKYYEHGESSLAQEDEPYRSVSPEYQRGQYSYDEDLQDGIEVVTTIGGTLASNAYDRGTVGDSVYDRGTIVDTVYESRGSVYDRRAALGGGYDEDTVASTLYGRGSTGGYDRNTVGGTLYDRSTVGGTLYGRSTVGGTLYDRTTIAESAYDSGVNMDNDYDRSTVAGTAYDRATINGGEYDSSVIVDADVDRGSVRGMEYDRGAYEHKSMRKIYATEANKAAIASSRRLNLRRQIMAPQPRLSEDSLPMNPSPRELSRRHSVSTRSSGRLNARMSGSNSGTVLSPNEMLIQRPSRETEPNLPPPHKMSSRRSIRVKTPPIIKDTKEYVRPIEFLEFRPEPFPEADNDTFCLRDAPPYAIKKQAAKKQATKKQARKSLRSRQVSESSSSEDSNTSDDSETSSQSSSSSCSSETDSTSEESRKKSSKRRSKRDSKKPRHRGKQQKKGRRHDSYSESEDSSEEIDAAVGGTLFEYITCPDNETKKNSKGRRSRRK